MEGETGLEGSDLRSKTKSFFSSYYFKTFLICLITASLTFIPFIIKNHGLLTVIYDFNYQQIPFNVQCNSAVKSGDIFWNWYTDLGTSFVGAYSFYTLGSPFFWLSLLFPAAAFPYVIGPMLILKYCVAGLTSYAYIQRFVKDKNYAVIGALLYAFSGFQTTNIVFNHFHDVVALFPLLLIGLEELVENKKIGLFAATVAINALLNYFFFVGEVVFLVLYFIFRFLIPDFKKYIKAVPKCIIEGAIGVGIACVLFLPSILFIMGNPRTDDFIYGGSSLCFNGDRYLALLKSILMPADLMPYQSVIRDTDYTSCSAYLPLFGVSLAAIFIFNKKNWVSGLMKCSVVFACVPILNSIFAGFSGRGYTRWFYMPVLIMALASAHVLEEKDDMEHKKGLGFTLAATAGLVLFLCFYPYSKTHLGTIRHLKLFMIYAAFAFAGIIFTFLLLKIKNKKAFMSLAFALVIVFSSATGFVNVYKSQKVVADRQPTKGVYSSLITTSQKLKLPKDQSYRTELSNSDWNLSLVDNIPSVNSFISTVSPSIFEFYKSIGYPRVVISQNINIKGLPQLLSVKYFISQSKINGMKEYQKFFNGTKTIYVYEYEDYLPIGFTYDYYMTEKQFNSLKNDQRVFAMLKAVVLSDDEAKKVNGILKPLPLSKFGEMDTKHVKSDVAAHNNECSYYFYRYNKGFTAKIQSTSQKYAFFSVPYDKGWSVTVNSKPTEIIDSNGFMIVPITKGENYISFTYEIPGMKLGILITVFSILLLIAYVMLMKFIRKLMSEKSVKKKEKADKKSVEKQTVDNVDK